MAGLPRAFLWARLRHSLTVSATSPRLPLAQIHTQKMTLADDVNIEEFVMSKEELSGADIKAMCTEAGLLALRERRMKVSHAEFRKAREYVMYKKKGGAPEGLYL